MMNGGMKRKIDSLRDLLVGVLPVPTDQIKQITLALIYKFMSDQNQTLKDLGGGDFFAGDFAPYAWTRLMDPAVSAAERVKLYRDGLEKMPANPHIPELFREIFRGAYLPFNNPSTLDMFLKGINEIEYTHSEDLGDAFEHLLSVMGAQGDAGQFRTPRHIIDFIVAAVDPHKGQRVLDPACGTAGFLVSAYRHILKANTLPGSPEIGSALAPDERARLTDDFCGYDISSDMARLSRVNLYLHLFPDPKIYEYDTLTSLERWDEIYDCILTNPPFMSPKGGIQPHNRFSIPSKRSEVLFVDYILDHLAPDGRAGIIVPEGVIFQSQNAHKALRKKLVEENFLYALVSLPAGVFQPYSGVKTSILLIDRALARQSKEILFIKVENDGFDLGAQRNPIEKNDLPEIQRILIGFKNSIYKSSNKYLHVVTKKEILLEKNITLSVERYIQEKLVSSKIYPSKPLEDICEFKNGLWQGKKEPFINVRIIRNTNFGKNGKLDLSNVAEHFVEQKQFEDKQLISGDIVLENSGGGPTQPVGRVVYFDIEDKFLYSFSNFTSRLRVTDSLINSKYIFLVLNYLYYSGVTENLQKRTSGIRNLDKSGYKQIKIPLPPLEVQREIVDEIEGYQKIIDGACMVVDNWKPRIKMDPEWPKVALGSISTIVRGSSPRPRSDPKYYGGFIPRLMVADVTRDGMYSTPQIDYLTEEGAKLSRPMKKGSLIMAVSGQPGVCTLLATDACIHDGFIGFRDLDISQINPEYAYYVLSAMKDANSSLSVGAIFQNLSTEQVKKIEIPLPKLETQNSIVHLINNEIERIKSFQKLISEYKKAIIDRLLEIWGEEVEK